MINYVLDKTRLARIFQGIGILTLALSILTGCESSLDAERAEQRMPGLRYFDDYQVAYGFVPASSLPTVVRERYGFSDSEAVILTVAVSTVSEPKNVPATITGYTVNLTKQRRQLEFDQLVQNDYLSYIATFGVDTRATFDVYLQILPEGSDVPLQVEFREKVIL